MVTNGWTTAVRHAKVAQFAPPHDGVRHHVAGGLEHGGGISRLVGYVRAAGGAGVHRITDTRGPRWSPWTSPFRLAAAMTSIASDAILARGRIQHLHIAGRGSTPRKLILGAWSRLWGRPYVLHLHDYDYAEDLSRRARWQHRPIARLFRGAERVIVLGQRDAGTVHSLGVPDARISILHNAVPDPTPAPAGVTRRSCDAVTLVFLGQLGPRKGVPELLQALASPAMAPLRWSAVLAGDGPVDAYRSRADALGLGDRVELTGWLPASETAALCRRSDILALPSHGEGMAMAVLEGLAHGLAVVTTPVGSHAEVLTDGETCRFVPPGDAEALAKVLAELVADAPARRRIAEAGRALHAEQLGLPAYMHRLNAILADVGRAPGLAPNASEHRA
jgi:glycosyltransferase involved in cell wall biosynthesis